jgi:hypothetical protein
MIKLLSVCVAFIATFGVFLVLMSYDKFVVAPQQSVEPNIVYAAVRNPADEPHEICGVADGQTLDGKSWSAPILCPDNKLFMSPEFDAPPQAPRAVAGRNAS